MYTPDEDGEQPSSRLRYAFAPGRGLVGTHVVLMDRVMVEASEVARTLGLRSTPAWSHGPQPQSSRDVLWLRNASDRDATVDVWVYYSERDPAGPYRFWVHARSTHRIRFDELHDPAPIARDQDFATVVESDVPILVSHAPATDAIRAFTQP